MRFDLLVNTMYAHARSTGVLTVNNPEIWRPLLAITDAVAAYAAAVEAPPTLSGVFNIASENVRIADVAFRLQKYFKDRHREEVQVIVKNIPDVRNYKVAYEKAQKELGFHPTGSVESVLSDIDQHIPAGINLGDDMYYNIRTFQKLLIHEQV